MKKIIVLTGGVLPDPQGLTHLLQGKSFEELLDKSLDEFNRLQKLASDTSKIWNDDVVFVRKNNVYSAQVPLLPRLLLEGTGEYVEMRALLIKKIGPRIMQNVKVEACSIPDFFDSSSSFYVEFAEDFSLEAYKFYYVDLADELSTKPNLVKINKFTGEYEMPGFEDDVFFSRSATHYKCDLVHLVKNRIWVYSVKVTMSGRVVVARHLYVYLPELRFICELTERIVDEMYFLDRGHHRRLPEKYKYLTRVISSTRTMFMTLRQCYSERIAEKSKNEYAIVLPKGFSLGRSSLFS